MVSFFPIPNKQPNNLAVEFRRNAEKKTTKKK